jgi:hypothetical protein
MLKRLILMTRFAGIIRENPNDYSLKTDREKFESPR